MPFDPNHACFADPGRMFFREAASSRRKPLNSCGQCRESYDKVPNSALLGTDISLPTLSSPNLPGVKTVGLRAKNN